MELGTLAGAAKGAAELANKNSGFWGKLFPYFGIKKEAVDAYIKDIEKSDMPADTKAYLIMNTKKHFKELKNQAAIAEKAVESAKEGIDFSDSSKVDEEWLDRFMDSAKFVSSEEMQLIWGKVLAGEFENPGSTPRNMIRILSEFTPELAQAFRVICSMKVDIFPLDDNGDIENSFSDIIVPYGWNELKFLDFELSFDILNELETLGVIKMNNIVGYRESDISNVKSLIRIENELILTIKFDNKHFPIGDVILTSAGKNLQVITEPIKLEGYYELVRNYMEKQGILFSDNHDYVLEYEDGKPIVKRKSEQE